MDCEICHSGEGFPGDINRIPVIVCVNCLRRGKLTETGNLRERMETWMWKRKVLRKIKASFRDRLEARTQWILAKHEYEAREDARFVRTASKHLNDLIRRVEQGRR